MRKFHDLTVRDVVEEAPDAVRIALDVPSELKDEYGYMQGQHLTLRTEIDGEDIRRSYSICTSVAENDLQVVVRHLPGGRFSGYIRDRLKPGDSLSVFPPTGHFYVPLDPGNARHYVAFAAGAGITPIMSIIKTTLETEPDSRFTLLYGNRSGETTIFRSAISTLKNRYMTRFAFYHFLSRQEQEVGFFNGRLDGDKTRDILARLVSPAQIDEAFICGPDSMIEAVREALETAGVDPAHIHDERFTNQGQVGSDAARDRPRPVGKVDAGDIRLLMDGTEHSIPYDPKMGTVLEAAEAAGLEAPFSCRAGVCTTCRARLKEGEVEMDVNYGLEPDEVEQGYILTCQAVPKTRNLVISFDE